MLILWKSYKNKSHLKIKTNLNSKGSNFNSDELFIKTSGIILDNLKSLLKSIFSNLTSYWQKSQKYLLEIDVFIFPPKTCINSHNLRDTLGDIRDKIFPKIVYYIRDNHDKRRQKTCLLLFTIANGFVSVFHYFIY